MTTTFLLVRHAAHDRAGTVLCGRMPGIGLGDIGLAQAERLADRLASEPVAAVRSSPIERARQTAEPIAARLGQPLAESNSLIEIDFGAWTGMSFAELGADRRWHAWNAARAVNRPPYGESMIEAQARIVGALETLRRSYRDRAVVLVSHGDVIKAALLFHLGLSLDCYDRFDIDPASISTLVVGDWGAKLLRLNEVLPA